jgi:phosphoglycolate phosphatase
MEHNILHNPGLIIWDHDGTLVNTELREFELFPGIREILFDLKNIGFELAIWTARPRASTIASIKRLEIAPFIGEIYCYDDGLPKPHPQGLIKVSGAFPKSRILHIGDSMTDVEGALAFGVDVIGACWYSSALKDSFKAMTPLVAMKVDDCRELISKKFNVNL